jgi:hypothetical protein
MKTFVPVRDGPSVVLILRLCYAEDADTACIQRFTAPGRQCIVYGGARLSQGGPGDSHWLRFTLVRDKLEDNLPTPRKLPLWPRGGLATMLPSPCRDLFRTWDRTTRNTADLLPFC